MASRNNRLIILCCWLFLLPVPVAAEIKTWTGYGGDGNWLNILNWSGSSVPVGSDDVLLDNADLPVSYEVMLPDVVVTLRTLRINPSPGKNIELILPVTNLFPDAFIVTGPGYGIELYAGAIFRNASGISSGESLQIADSMSIHDGGRYIHQTRAAHATSILKILSVSPGTEQGVFDFDVPRASYTISVSNRVYGSLELHSSAHGGPVNYTCRGANPLLVRGTLRLGEAVSMSMSLNGPNGNIQVAGDFIQAAGQLNLASVAGQNTILRVRGDIYQSPGATITESTSGIPFVELNGDRLQQIAMAGTLLNQVGFRLNNAAGASLSLPLLLPYTIELLRGTLHSSAQAMLVLDTRSVVIADSSNLSGSYIDGPVRKLGLDNAGHFLFPVGKSGFQRWLELKSITGNYTVEYHRADPHTLGAGFGSGLDHISALEYWTIDGDGGTGPEQKVELSFAVAASGLITDPQYLNVARFQSGNWEDGGHTAKTGNSFQGSVTGTPENFTASVFTLASTMKMENPLPVTKLQMQLRELSDKILFSLEVETDEIPDFFEVFEKHGAQLSSVAKINAIDQISRYTIATDKMLTEGNHFFVLRMTDKNGKLYEGNTVLFTKKNGPKRLSLVTLQSDHANFIYWADEAGELSYSVSSIDGRAVCQGSLLVKTGINYLAPECLVMVSGLYVLRTVNTNGEQARLLFRK